MIHISGIQRKVWAREFSSGASTLAIVGDQAGDFSGDFINLPNNAEGAGYLRAFGEADFRRFNVPVGTLTNAPMTARLRYRPMYANARGD